jgi:uncharacterized protein
VLTRDLLLFRTRLGKVRPTFVDVARPELMALAEGLVASVEACLGRSKDELEQELEPRIGSFPRPKVARGLAKLLLDRCTFEEPRDEVASLRRQSFGAAAAVLRGLPPDASLEQYEARLADALPRPIEELRAELHADLPGQRGLLEWRRLGPRELLDRYNMALAQGLVLYASRLVVEAQGPELLRVRRVLRWLKFCRLVGQVLRHGEDWTLEVEGPASILSMQKKYGLQLAMFLPAVPVLRRFRLEAEIRLPRREPLVLELGPKDPLVSTHEEALGHIPPEIAYVAGRFKDDDWQLDLTPEPRPVGPADLCVPDLTFRHRKSGQEVYVELFHRWHDHALVRRVSSLRSRPDPHLFLAVDRTLARRPEVAAALDGFDQAVLFNAFPSEKVLRPVLQRFEPV